MVQTGAAVAAAAVVQTHLKPSLSLAARGARGGPRAWLRRHRQRGEGCLLLAAYVVADVGKLVLVRWANNKREAADSFHPSSVILVQLVFSALIALGIAGSLEGKHGIREAVRLWPVVRCTPMSAFFFVSQACTVRALLYVDEATVKLSTQLILPLTACLSVWLVPGCQYSKQQWVTICTICVGTLAFNAVQAEGGGDAGAPGSALDDAAARDREARALGLVLCGAVVVANSLGSVVGERFLKGASEVPWVCLKAQMLLAEISLVVFVLWAVEVPRAGRGWLYGWDGRVLLCALGWVPATWLSTLVTTRFSTVVKNVAQCVSTLVTYFAVLLGPSGEKHSASSTLLALVVVLCVGTFTLQCRQEELGATARCLHEAATLNVGPAWVRGRTDGEALVRFHLVSNFMEHASTPLSSSHRSRVGSSCDAADLGGGLALGWAGGQRQRNGWARSETA